MLALLDVAGSGALDYLRVELFNRPAIVPPSWAPPPVVANAVSISTSIKFTPLQTARYLSVKEQRVFDAALRRSVKVISSGKQKS
jgi:hypothetical protein